VLGIEPLPDDPAAGDGRDQIGRGRHRYEVAEVAENTVAD
jgi:hypothetical protein